MEKLIKRMTEESVWEKWVAANSADGATQAAKNGCISATPKSGCISATGKTGCIS
ncbi:hypothetical protein JQK87_22130 [Streptomyces sp. G44]|uniref:hypothetical protein n=1 Tax=Streptomyces sp. G44 TaxID=2807632 RepID=UPI00195FBD58|nr:hypothetical protein [Streptomyces sp. G44]MBM7171050.1 hypothetical protein [Streptomyces sp. G44]